jgi:hypothetical protein
MRFRSTKVPQRAAALGLGFLACRNVRAVHASNRIFRFAEVSQHRSDAEKRDTKNIVVSAGTWIDEGNAQ